MKETDWWRVTELTTEFCEAESQHQNCESCSVATSHQQIWQSLIPILTVLHHTVAVFPPFDHLISIKSKENLFVLRSYQHNQPSVSRHVTHWILIWNWLPAVIIHSVDSWLQTDRAWPTLHGTNQTLVSHIRMVNLRPNSWKRCFGNQATSGRCYETRYKGVLFLILSVRPSRNICCLGSIKANNRKWSSGPVIPGKICLLMWM